MTIPNHALIYSSNEKIKISDLKQNISQNINTTKIEIRMKNHQINAITQNSQNYHYKFKLIKSKPYIIYYQWNLNLLNNNILWIVWPRNPSEYGKKIMKKLFETIKNYNLTTISGLASGIDTYCHSLSIENKIPTIAVLGAGLKRFLESYDKTKIQKIINNWWLILSEFKLTQQPQKRSFPQRNRIIAWLSNCLFLPEAWKKSGSLITANFAYENKIPIYWAPNSIFSPQSEGLTEYFFQKKITAIHNFSWFLEKHFTSTNKKNINTKEKLTNNEKHIFSYFKNHELVTISELLNKCWLEFSQLLIILSQLEIKNYIIQDSANSRKIQ